MQFSKNLTTEQYYDVSIVVPIEDLEDIILKRFIERNYTHFRRNGVEVIFVASAGINREGLRSMLQCYPFVNWVVYEVGGSASGWTRRSIFFNLGMAKAENNLVMFLEPEAELATEAVHRLRHMFRFYRDIFTLGKVGNDGGEESYVLMAEKSALTRIGGFAESCLDRVTGFGDLVVRLEMTGKKRMEVSEDGCVSMKLSYPKQPDARNPLVEMPADVIFHWRLSHGPGERTCLLESFDKYWVPSPDVFEKQYKLICLIAVRNEREHVPAVLKHLDEHCSGIILLDDGSTDGSYEEAFSENLLLKVRKQYAGFFDDLGNRNLLLRLGHLFSADWFVFMDADERVDTGSPRLKDLQPAAVIDTVVFRFVHLWDSDDCYREDVPMSQDGFFYRYRMFRNKGFMQIVSNRVLHFPATPFIINCDFQDIRVLVLHHGLKQPEIRKKKFEKYSREDELGRQQGHGYEYLIEPYPKKRKVDEIMLTINQDKS